MATSGSTDFSVSRNDIIREALAEIGAYDPSDGIPGEELVRCNQRLNMMVKAWMTRGWNLHRRQEVTCFVKPSQTVYTFGTDHITASYAETTLAATAASGATSITVSSATGIAADYYIGIKQDDDSVHWTTVAKVSSTTITLDSALTDDCTDGSPQGTSNKVYCYQTKVASPRKVFTAYKRDTSGNDVEMFNIGRETYERLSDKDSTGGMTSYIHDPQLSASKIKVWPATTTDVDKLVMIVDRKVEDFDSASNTPDFPQEWYEALYLGLASNLSSAYGLPIQERAWIKSRADEAFAYANSFDVEEASVRFQMDYS